MDLYNDDTAKKFFKHFEDGKVYKEFDRTTGLVKQFGYDKSSDTFHQSFSQDCQDIVDLNTRLRNDAACERTRGSDEPRLVARVPLAVYLQWQAKYGDDFLVDNMLMGKILNEHSKLKTTDKKL